MCDGHEAAAERVAGTYLPHSLASLCESRGGYRPFPGISSVSAPDHAPSTRLPLSIRVPQDASPNLECNECAKYTDHYTHYDLHEINFFLEQVMDPLVDQDDDSELIFDSPAAPTSADRPAHSGARFQESRYSTEEAHQAALKQELENIKRINQVIEGVVESLEKAKSNMDVS